MTPANNDEPPSIEIVKQLNKILLSETFANRPKEAALLSRIVTSALNQEVLSEKDILWNLYPEQAENPKGGDLSSVVRVTASHLRGRLDQYYEASGKEDLVRIQLAVGKSYAPVFSFQIHAEALRHYQRGVHYSKILVPLSQQLAIDEFWVAANAAPPYLPALISIAHGMLNQMWISDLLDLTEGLDRPQPAALVRCDQTLKAAGEKAMNACARCFEEMHGGEDQRPASHRYLYLASITLGTVQAAACNWKRARFQFENALSVDPVRTSESGWYAMYLWATGESEWALQLVRSQAEKHEGDESAQLLYGFFLYLARRFDEALKVLFRYQVTEYPDKSNPVLQLLRGLVVIACRRDPVALAFIGAASYVSDDEWTILECLTPGSDERPQKFPGLLVLCMVRTGLWQEATQLLDEMEHHKFGVVKPLQLAIAYMAVGKKKEAIEMLYEAWFEGGDSLMLWLRFWPLFDPLRGERKFQRLVHVLSREPDENDLP